MGFLSDLFSSSSTSTSTNTGYKPAMSVVNAQLGNLQSLPQMQAYGGPYAAAMNPYMQQGIENSFNFGNTGAGAQFANQMGGQGQQAFNFGSSGMQDLLGGMSRGGPRFNFDQGTYNTMMNNAMPGLRSLLDTQGRMNSMQLQSNLGSLVSQAGQTGSLGSNPLSKLGQGSAALQAQNTLNNQQFAANLFNNANAQASAAGMQGGMANLNASMGNNRALMSGFGNMMNMGNTMQNQGYRAGVGNLGLMNQAGNAQQRFDQFGADMARQQFMDRQSIPLQDAANRLGLASQVADTFGTRRTTTEQTPSTFNSLMSAGAAISGLPGAFGGSWSGMGGMFGGGGGGAAQYFNNIGAGELAGIDWSNF